jgi:hypothetical protein
MSPPRALHASAAGARDGATRLAHDSHDANRLVGPRTEDDDAPGSDRARRGHPPRARMDTPFVGSRAPALDVPRAPHPSSASLTTTDNTRSGNRGDRGDRGDAPLPLGRGARARGGARRRQDSAFPHAARGFFRDAANVSGDEDDETPVELSRARTRTARLSGLSTAAATFRPSAPGPGRPNGGRRS